MADEDNIVDEASQQAVVSQRIAEKLVRDTLQAHPLPWRIEQDWTCEVVASDGHVVAKYILMSRAQELVAFAQKLYDSDLVEIAELHHKHPELFVDDDGTPLPSIIAGSRIAAFIFTESGATYMPPL